jgi:hypothetical protein
LRVVSRRKRRKCAFLLSARVFCPNFSGFGQGVVAQVSVNLALRTYLPRGFRTGFRMFETVPSGLWLVWWQAKTQVLLVRL